MNFNFNFNLNQPSSRYLIGLILFTLIFGLWEIQQNKYAQKFFHQEESGRPKQIGVALLILAHYALYYMIYFSVGFLYFSRNNFWLWMYLAFLVFVLGSWYYFDNKCFLTVWTNQIMGVKDDFGFRDPYDLWLNRYPETGDPEALNLRDKGYYLYMYGAIFLTACLIWNN